VDKDLVVIGGGAAGIFAALAFAEANPTGRVCVLERGSVFLAKVRVSGGGRCNLTNSCYEPAQLVLYYPRGGDALRGAFTRFQPRDTMNWFTTRGVQVKIEPDGRVFPVSDRSETVIACMLAEANRLKIEMALRAAVEDLKILQDGFELHLRDGRRITSTNLVLATGGERGGYQMAAGLGHTIAAPVPSLFTFKIEDVRLAGLAGVSVPDAKVRLPDLRLEQHGPVLITHWGLSGPAILRLSAWGARALSEVGYKAELCLSWLPDINSELLTVRLAAYKAQNGRKIVQGRDPIGRLPLRLWKSLSTAAGMNEELTWASASRGQLQRLAEEMLAGRYQISGKGEFKEEFVTCGGVSLNEIDFRRMESKKFPGLFFAGEVLDIDGVTGGFNLQSAWTTGWIAGQAAAVRVNP
jgi:predicted Rossmann fold flavoprotein